MSDFHSVRGALRADLERTVTGGERDRVRVQMLQRSCREVVEMLDAKRANLSCFETAIDAPEVDLLMQRAQRNLLDAIDELVVVDAHLRRQEGM